MKSWAKTNNRYFALPYWFDYAFLIIFALCAWYLQNTFIRNYSGTGLQLPFNNLIWAALALGVLLLFIKAAVVGKLHYSNTLWIYLFVLTCLLLPIAFNTFAHMREDDYRIEGLLGIGVFLLALHQLSWPYAKQAVLGILGIAFLLQVGFGINQYYFFFVDEVLSSPGHNNNMLVGSFQQVNVLSSFMALGSIITLYAVAKLPFGRVVGLLIGLLICATCMHLSALSADTGRFNLVFSVCLAAMIFAWQYKRWHLLIIPVVLIGLFLQPRASHEWLERTHYHAHLSETPTINTQVNDFLNTNINKLDTLGTRPSIYYTALHAYLEKPFMGHGFGSYFYAHVQQQPKIRANPPEAFAYKATNNMGHPHNELLYWMVELGSLPLLGALVLFGYLCVYLKRHPRRSVWFIIALPLMIHSMLEYPFYMSSLHLFSFVLCVHWLCHQSPKTVQLSRFPALAILVGLSLIVWQQWLLNWNTYHAQQQHAEYRYSKRQKVALLDVKNPGAMSEVLAKELQYTNLLYLKNDANPPPELYQYYIEWAEKQILSRPFPVYYKRLALSYYALGELEKVTFYQNEIKRLFDQEFTISKRASKSANTSVGTTDMP